VYSFRNSRFIPLLSTHYLEGWRYFLNRHRSNGENNILYNLETGGGGELLRKWLVGIYAVDIMGGPFENKTSENGNISFLIPFFK
jgi:hypothetical protein